MSHGTPLGSKTKTCGYKPKRLQMGTNIPAALAYNSPWDGFPFTKNISQDEVKKEEMIDDGMTIAQQTIHAKNNAESKAAERTTYAKSLAEVEIAINEVFDAAQHTLKGSWVEVSNPALTGSWVQVRSPDLQNTWIDGPPSRAPSCSDDNTTLPDLRGVMGKAEFVWEWLKAMGGAIQG